MVQGIDPVAFSAFEKQAWRQSATAYDRYFGPLTAQTGSRLLDAVAEQPEGKALLDVATGPGYLAKQAATRGFSKVVGLDFSDPMIALAKATGPGNAEFRVGDAQNLVEEGDCSFDAVTMNVGLLHMSLPNMEIRPFPCLRGRRSFISAIAPTVLVRCTLLVLVTVSRKI